MPYEIKLIEVGRGKISRTVQANDCFGITEAELAAVDECGKHLMSRENWIEEDEPGKYGVFVGMGRRVGTVEIKEKAAAQ